MPKPVSTGSRDATAAPCAFRWPKLKSNQVAKVSAMAQIGTGNAIYPQSVFDATKLDTWQPHVPIQTRLPRVLSVAITIMICAIVLSRASVSNAAFPDTSLGIVANDKPSPNALCVAFVLDPDIIESHVGKDHWMHPILRVPSVWSVANSGISCARK